jgi:hypothetical protein
MAITSEEEKKNCWVDGTIIALLINLGCLHPVACLRSGDGSFYIRLRNVTIVGRTTETCSSIIA